MRRASKIVFNGKPIHPHTHALLQTHAYTMTIIYLDAKTYAPFCSPSHFIVWAYTQSAMLWYESVSAFLSDFHSMGNALFFSVFLRAPPFQYVSYCFYVCVQCAHTYMRPDRMLLCYFIVSAGERWKREYSLIFILLEFERCLCVDTDTFLYEE